MKFIQENISSHLWELKFMKKVLLQKAKLSGMGSKPGAITSKLFWAGYIGMLQTLSGWWFGTWFLFSHVFGIIIPIDELIFFRGVGQAPTSVDVSDGISYEIQLNHHLITINPHQLLSQYVREWLFQLTSYLCFGPRIPGSWPIASASTYPLVNPHSFGNWLFVVGKLTISMDNYGKVWKTLRKHNLLMGKLHFNGHFQ